MTEIAAHPELHERLLERFQTGVFAGLRRWLSEAVEAGHLSPDTDPDRVLEIVAGAVVLRLLLQPGEPIDEVWEDQVVSIVLHGVRPDAVGAPAPRRPPGRSS